MSSRRLRLLVEANDDLRSILQYTTSQWGSAQRMRLESEFDGVFAGLVMFAEMGVARDDLGKGVRVHEHHPFRIVYLPSDEFLTIVRVVHYRRKLTRKLVKIPRSST